MKAKLEAQSGEIKKMLASMMSLERSKKPMLRTITDKIDEAKKLKSNIEGNIKTAKALGK